VIPSSTWCVVHPDGHVEHQEGEPTMSAIRKSLGGYKPAEIALDTVLHPYMRLFRADVVARDALANYPVRAIVQGHLVPPMVPIVGRMVLTGVGGEGLPADVLARLHDTDSRARERDVMAQSADTQVSA
jgi:hypothetical protein